MDDVEPIAAVARGYDVPLRELFQQNTLSAWPPGRRYAPAEVEDVLQETFLVVWRGAIGGC